MKRHWVVMILAAVLQAAVTALTFHLHSERNQAILSQFQRHQLSYAKYLSKQIQFFIQTRSRGLRALSSFPSLQSRDVEQKKRDIAAYAGQIATVYVDDITLCDEVGTVLFSTNAKSTLSSRADPDILAWA